MIELIKNIVKKKKYIVFDFDGVILDSVEIKTNAFATIYSKYGPEIVSKVVDYHRKNNGISRFEKFKYYHEFLLNARFTDKEAKVLNRQFCDLVFKEIVIADEIPGVFDFIYMHLNMDKTCIINSAAPQIEIRKIIKERGLSDQFECVFGSPLTKSENFEKIKKKFNCSYLDIVFFGDSLSDMNAACEVGVDFIGIGDYSNIFSESQYSPLFVRDFTEIID